MGSRPNEADQLSESGRDLEALMAVLGELMADGDWPGEEVEFFGEKQVGDQFWCLDVGPGGFVIVVTEGETEVDRWNLEEALEKDNPRREVFDPGQFLGEVTADEVQKRWGEVFVKEVEAWVEE